jgi:hypothetical protein
VTRDRERLEALLAGALGPESMPAERAAAIRAAIGTADLRPRPRRWRWLPALAAAVLLVPAAAWWRAAQAPRLEATPPGQPVTGFERMALDLHERGADEVEGAALRTASAEAARAWALARTGVDVNLPSVRPAEDAGRFDLHAVQAVRYRGAPAVAVRYAVDGQPVTLAVARDEDVPDRSPAWTLAGKRIRAHTVGGHNLLSWTNSGQSYVLVTDLPHAGRRACFVCHTQAARRRVIDRLGP